MLCFLLGSNGFLKKEKNGIGCFQLGKLQKTKKKEQKESSVSGGTVEQSALFTE